MTSRKAGEMKNYILSCSFFTLKLLSLKSTSDANPGTPQRTNQIRLNSSGGSDQLRQLPTTPRRQIRPAQPTQNVQIVQAGQQGI